MLDVSAEAQEVVREAMEAKGMDRPLRIYLAGGCGGSQLALGLDELRETDEQYEFDGYTYVVDKLLAGQMGDLRLDYIDDGISKGLVIGSANPVPQPADGCSGCSC